MTRLYQSDEQLAKKINRMKIEGRAMEMDQALALCGKQLAAWLELMAPKYQWFEVRGGEYELFIESQQRSDFKGRVHARKVQ